MWHKLRGGGALKAHVDVFNSSIMMVRELYEKMLEECQWYVTNKCLFDTVWNYYCTFHSKTHCIEQPLIMFRELSESDSRSKNLEKRKFVDRRYYSMKLQFILSNNIPIGEAMDVLMGEYDYIATNAEYRGEQKVRDTKAYKIGKKITNIFGWIRKVLK